MRVGYLVDCKPGPCTALQFDALAAAGCELICQETVTNTSAGRPRLAGLLSQLGPGDTLYVHRLGQLGNSLRHLLAAVASLRRTGAGLVSLTDAIDTTAAQGELVFGLFAVLADFEHHPAPDHAPAAAVLAHPGRVGGRRKGLKETGPPVMTPSSLHREQPFGINKAG